MNVNAACIISSAGAKLLKDCLMQHFGPKINTCACKTFPLHSKKNTPPPPDFGICIEMSFAIS